MKSFSPVGTLVVLTLLEGFSFFGRTSALSPFLPSLCSDLSVSMTQISGAYMLANLIAGLLLPFVGKCYDRAGLADFVKAFVKIFGLSFAIIGIPCTLGVDTRSGGKMTEWMTEYSWILLLIPLAFPGSVRAIISTFFRNRRHKLLFLATGVTMLFSTIFVYTVAAGLDRTVLWIYALGYVPLLHFIVLRSIRDREKREIFLGVLLWFILFCMSVFAFVVYSDPRGLWGCFIGVLFWMVRKLKSLRRKWQKLQKKLEAYGINFERLILPLLVYWRIKHPGKDFHRCQPTLGGFVCFINVIALFFFFHEYKTTLLCFYRHTNGGTGIHVGGTFMVGDAFFATPRVCNGMRTAVCDAHNGFDARYLLPNQSTLDGRNVFLYVECRLVFRVIRLQLSPRETIAANRMLVQNADFIGGTAVF